MELSIPTIKQRKVGRPRTDAIPVMVRIAPDQLTAIDAYIATQPEPHPTRPEAIRRLLAAALATRGD